FFAEATIMSLVELMRNASESELISEDGEHLELQLLPPLSQAEIGAFETRLPCPLPREVRDLLSYCRGFNGVYVDIVEFRGEGCLFEFDCFPHGLPFAADGFGNFWVVDLFPESREWGPIYYACHDAPIILYQSPSLEHFLTELFKTAT